MTFDLCRLLPGPGEEWLVRSVGAYLPAVFEEVLDVVDAVILTEKVCALGDPGLGDSQRGREQWQKIRSPGECPGSPERSPPGLVDTVTQTWSI